MANRSGFLTGLAGRAGLLTGLADRAGFLTALANRAGLLTDLADRGFLERAAVRACGASDASRVRWTSVKRTWSPTV